MTFTDPYTLQHYKNSLGFKPQPKRGAGIKVLNACFSTCNKLTPELGGSQGLGCWQKPPKRIK